MTAPVTLHDRPIPVQFEPPLQSPAPLGLYAATTWTEIGADQPSRHLNGVEVRPVGNYGGAGQSGIWPNDSCATGTVPDPALKKEGLRPEGLDPFASVTVWAHDECDLTAPSRDEVQARAPAGAAVGGADRCRTRVCGAHEGRCQRSARDRY
jgi:hypothetical protein